MTWDELLAHPRGRDADGVLTVLEEIDDDTGTAVYRCGGESHTVRRTGQALDVQVLHGEVVDEEAAPAPSSRGRLVAASVAAAGLAWLATRRRG
jgi:hypothetical protein